jgi:WhiB family redox-sensing transcriptional regulator
MWTDHAACLGKDPELFYPPKGENAQDAKAICRVCPVAIICLNYALARRERYGVWGGMTEKERRRLLRLAC